MRIAAILSTVLAALAVLGGPWLFGAWEGWWFWPFAVVLFAALAAFGVVLFDAETALAGFDPRRLRRDVAPAFAAGGVFLLYGVARLAQTAVHADAIRSFLLFLLPFGVAGVAALAAGARARRIGFGLLAVNALALGLYGIVNHRLTGSERVLWMPGYPMYIAAGRATGSYYCPNHFAGALELGGALALGLILDRGRARRARLFGLALLVVCGWGVILSRSRGGGLTLLALLIVAPLLGLGQWQPRFRWALRLGLLGLAALAAGLVAWRGGGYVERFRNYPWAELKNSDRVVMAGGALRAWRTAPVAGIGPGMHQNLWPHFAATADGDREKKIWPSRANLGFHSYEVHSDWIQLLEEYGALGLALFLAALFLAARILWRGLRREAAAWRAAAWARPDGGGFYAAILGGALAMVAMILHEAGDFNLQMPATGWMLGAILGLAAGEAARADQ